MISIGYGILFGKYKVFPYKQVKNIEFLLNTKYSDGTNHFNNYPNECEDIISVSPVSVDSIAIKLNEIVFGFSSLPLNMPDSVYKIEDTEYDNVDNLKNIYKFEINQKYNGIIHFKNVDIHPQVSNQRLLLYHQGHQGDFLRGKETLEYFINKGFTVYAFCMPLLGKNNQPIVSLKKIGTVPLRDHDNLKFLENPIQFFISPVIIMINYSINKQFQDITMVGISGGGWTTTLASAIDSRINYSFPVAGSYPMFIKFQRPKKAWGDFEQTYEVLYKNVNYVDLYTLGSIGSNRFQLQILNKYDPCCFDGEDYKKYISRVKNAVEKFEFGSFDVFLDTSHREHKISKVALEEIFNRINHNF